MRKACVFAVIVALAVGFVATKPAQAIPLFPDELNTFSGIAIVEDEGFLNDGGAFSYIGSEVSVDDKGTAATADDVVNLPQASPVSGLAPPAMVIFETDTVTDGSSITFGQELTAVIGGLWPTALTTPFSSGLDNGLAPGSVAADGRPDQQPKDPGTGIATFTVHFGPGATVGGVPAYPYPNPPVFEIYEDVPTTANLDLGSGSRTITEAQADFDGAVDATPHFPASPLAGVIGASEPVLGGPSQFDAGGVNMGRAVNGSLFLSGWIDSASATYTFFDTSNVAGANPVSATSGYVYKLEVIARGVVTGGAMAQYMTAIDPGAAYDGSDIGVTFSATLFGRAYSSLSNPGGGFVLGVDPFAAWNVDQNVGGNAGNSSLTILPTIPEPGTMALLGLALVPLAFRRKK